MLDPGHAIDTQSCEADAPRQGPGACVRCRTESSPHPCPAFLGNGTICQRNWCAHNWADHD